ncbi:hypothetical protein PARPLA_01291 [Rhodobacteraceae bacterium THAF1]|nr:hypothetical protein [Palleronia sp. THAF1]QFU09526.1 hypothetical protein FIU81_12650 [Palleronia sp. THAF1]VDC21793.1 hypothetical protein PARPLA_01291 [Rhodobacteraceae bacterium THAF1]
MSIGSILRRVFSSATSGRRRTATTTRSSSPKAQLAKGAARTAKKHLK